jgi:predicted methyltransferase
MYDQAKQFELVRFATVAAGSTVIDVYPGAGDWTRILSDVVGPKGRVYSFVPAEVAHFTSDPVGLIRALAQQPGRENVVAISADVVALAEAAPSVDVVWMHLFYHDLHTPLIQARGATASAFNQSVYASLKSGGRYVIIDHAASARSGARDPASLHRIDPALVVQEVLEAGFVLDGQSDLLANDADDHAIRVFDPAIKGETDRFAYRFIRP